MELIGRAPPARIIIPLMILRACLLGFFLALSLDGAEPSVESTDLPRRPATPPERALETFRVKSGFRLELVAAEPMVLDPIALSFDESGNLFVLEMRDYSERRPEKLGRVRRLVDTDQDGRFDRATVYVDDLPWPTALCCYGGGIFVGATPDIWYCRDTDGDGVAESRQRVFTGFGSDYAPYETNRLNVQAMLNNLTWGLDQRVHGSASYSGGQVTCPVHPARPALNLRGRDFSFDPRTYDLRPESGGGQHGLALDNVGRKFICSNSSHCRLIMYEGRYADSNPFHSLPPAAVNIAEDGEAAPVFRTSPDEPWRVIRTRWRVAGLVSGPVEGGGRPSGYFTAATGITIYRGQAFPSEYLGDVFVADCGSNLIHHKKLRPKGASLTASRPADEESVEFLTSSDNWFRPVQLANGPEGALYIADMYREVIEHPWSLPQTIKQHLDLNSGNDRGRIYRIVPEDFKQRALPRLGERSTIELVKTLAHENGWHRDTAARLLYERQDQSAVLPLEEMVSNPPTPLAQLHALYALSGLQALKVDHLQAALVDADPAGRVHALRLVEQKASGAQVLAGAMSDLARDPDPSVRYQLALTIGILRPANSVAALKAIALAGADDPWITAAVIHGAGINSLELLAALAEEEAFRNAVVFKELAEIVGAQETASSRILLQLAEPKLARALPEIVAGLGAGLKRRGTTLAKLDSEGVLDQLFADAARDAANPAMPTAQRERAIQLLPFAKSSLALQTLGRILVQPGPLQRDTIRALGSFNDGQVPSLILNAWPQLTPQSRAQGIDVLLSRGERVQALLDALADGRLQASDLDPRQQQLLRNQSEPGMRARAGALLAAVRPAQREQAMAQYRGTPEKRGDAQHGRILFRERCASCHRVGEEGYAVGPDLATARAGGWEKLLGQILDPNSEVTPGYVSYTVETSDGETQSGIIVQETDAALMLRQANGVEARFLRSNISSLRSQGQSLMPEGLEAGLAVQDMADLLQFIAPR